MLPPEITRSVKFDELARAGPGRVLTQAARVDKSRPNMDPEEQWSCYRGRYVTG